MARRKSTIIDGDITLDDPGDSILNALERAGREDVSHVVTGGEIIMARDINYPLPAQDMLTKSD